MELTSLIGFTLDPNPASVLFHEQSGDREAESSPVPDRLRREERLKELRLVVRRHARSVVGHLEPDPDARVGQPDANPSLVSSGRLDRLLRVDDKVQQHLFQFGERRKYHSRGRCLNHAQRRFRQHQCADHDDRRKGRRDDQGRPSRRRGACRGVKPVRLNASELFNVAGLVTIVTGGASGIGYAYADVMAANGAVVTLIATFQGYTTAPTSEGVAYATTRTVVFSSIVTLALDFVMTAFLM